MYHMNNKTRKGHFSIWLLFAFMCAILSSLIGRIARYTPSSAYNLSLPKRLKISARELAELSFKVITPNRRFQNENETADFFRFRGQEKTPFFVARKRKKHYICIRKDEMSL